MKFFELAGKEKIIMGQFQKTEYSVSYANNSRALVHQVVRPKVCKMSDRLFGPERLNELESQRRAGTCPRLPVSQGSDLCSSFCLFVKIYFINL